MITYRWDKVGSRVFFLLGFHDYPYTVRKALSIGLEDPGFGSMSHGVSLDLLPGPENSLLIIVKQEWA